MCGNLFQGDGAIQVRDDLANRRNQSQRIACGADLEAHRSRAGLSVREVHRGLDVTLDPVVLGVGRQPYDPVVSLAHVNRLPDGVIVGKECAGEVFDVTTRTQTAYLFFQRSAHAIVEYPSLKEGLADVDTSA